MGVDASAVARVLGISTSFADLRNGAINYLPQRVVVSAQGSSAVAYPTTKYQVTSHPQAGARFGYGSPIHLICQQLLPDNGDGVGSIPVTVYPMADAGGASAAAGDITPSGTASLAGAYRLRIGGVLSDQFALPAGAVDVSSTCGLMGQVISNNLSMPVTVAYAYGAVTSAAAGANTGNGTVTALSVSGTPIPGKFTLVCTTHVTNGGVFQLTGPDNTRTTVTMTPGVGGTTAVVSQGVAFTLTDSTTDFVVGDTFTITVAATKLNATMKWKGSSGNGCIIEVIGDSVGAVFTVTQPSGGLINPSPAGPLAQMGNVWETIIINAMEITDTVTLDVLQNFGEGRWGTLVYKPLVCFTGNTITDQQSAVVVSNSRKTDRINSQIVAPGSVNLPFVVAAKAVARIASLANNNPPTDYGAEELTNIIPGADGAQWDYLARDAAVKAGSSTVEVNDGVIQIGDVVTFYHPTGDPTPAYRYVVDIVKLQQAIYNLKLIFAAKEWAAAPLVPDSQAVVNPNARKPKAAKAAAASMLESLGTAAIISDPATAKKTIVATIDSQNPKRLNLGMTIQLSGNTNVKSVDLFFGFFFGAQAAA